MAKKRLTPRDWLRAAYRALLRGGRDGVRIEALARDLGVTKGSFYWHFEDREHLLHALLEDWYERLTARVAAQVVGDPRSPRARLLSLMQTVTTRRLGRHDVEVRAWARYDPVAARYVRRVDRLRLEVVRSLFEQLGFKGRTLESRTRLFVYYQTAEPTIVAREKPAERDALMRARLDVLTAKAPSGR